MKPLLNKYSFTLCSFFFIISIVTKAQTPLNNSEKLATFCKFWGFLKYYHPAVADGSKDWDNIFIKKYYGINDLQSKEALNEFYLSWLDELGEVPVCKKCSPPGNDDITYNLDESWMKDDQQFTVELQSKLQFILSNRYLGKRYYANLYPFTGNLKPSNEKAYNDSIYPSAPMRLLTLSRFWNIINYYYPYKNVITDNWASLLTTMIPKFVDAQDTLNYHLAISELVANLHDSHSLFLSPYEVKHYYGNKVPPFKYKVIDEKAVVTSLYNDSIGKKFDYQVGDAIIKIRGQNIEDVIKDRCKYIGGSNRPAQLKTLTYVLLNDTTDQVKVTIERNGQQLEKMLPLYQTYAEMKPQPVKKELYKLLDGNIGYINLGELEIKQVNDIMKKLEHTKALIIDVRNYPKNTVYKVANHLNSESKKFVKFTRPNNDYPGTFKPVPAISVGRNNKNYYKGKVILLTDEMAQSHAEFTLMALKTAPNVTVVGSQTAGADGNVSTITLPGNFKLYMTGVGVFYPDGTPTQRVGIVPDIEIKPTINGIKAKKDEVLDKAIEIARQS
ncbi:hypothetical protein COR50_00480 [Chitinophaga caeni]|uniref:Tail specific protease domain-containing protein n=1 Tax=Chitinophaga caeni TaxID=2029983 RepID=A0A291QPB1_9BACT|nr:S41 family peptidase [Chitinophaga caeni]ATL45755.1 hypothetical protein COR50_00480 [Chitinophaga caeni]